MITNDRGSRVGFFGGTFDPVHHGHLLLAEHALEQLGLERVLWVPTGDPWRKSGVRVSPAADRVAMVQLVIEATASYELVRNEVERQGPSYSVDTLREVRKRFSKSELYFLLGLDALLDIPNWHQPAQLIELAQFAVAPRGNARLAPAELDRILPGLARRVAWIEMPTVDISGTELRKRAAQGERLVGDVPEAVAAYVQQRGLYRG